MIDGLDDNMSLLTWQAGDYVVEEGTTHNQMPAGYLADETKFWSQFQSKFSVCDAAGRAVAEFDTQVFAGCAWDGPVASALRSKYGKSHLSHLQMEAFCEQPKVVLYTLHRYEVQSMTHIRFPI